jgi:Sulfotransferase family
LPVGRPDFVGVGAQKAGTTWWFECLIEHPTVFHPPRIPKERHAFQPWQRLLSDEELTAAYAANFPRPLGTVTGEWSPRYMFDQHSLELLRRAAPDAKILVLLRDPVARLRSGLAHYATRRVKLSNEIVVDAVRRSLYEDQLRRLTSVFDARRQLVLQYERCVADPRRQMQRTLEFLDLEPFEPPSLERPVNARRHMTARTRRRIAEICRQVEDAYGERMSQDAWAVARATDVDLAMWPSVR